MSSYVLIMLLDFGGQSYSATMATANFSSLKACKVAGYQAQTLHPSIRFVCAKF